MVLSLQEYKKLIEGKTCRWCGTELTGELNYYKHDNGWEVAEFDNRQWLYVTCPNSKCQYDWALWKLGVSR